MPFHMTMQSQQQHPRPDSPNNMLPNHLKSPTHLVDPYSAGPQNTNTNHSMYNSMNNIHIPTSEYASLSSTEPEALNLNSKLNGFNSVPFRTSTSFNPFPGRPRNGAVPFRDASAAFNTFPPPSSEMYGGQNLQPPQSPPSYGHDGLHHPGRAHDFAGVGPTTSVPNGLHQVGQSFIDPMRRSMELLQSQVNQQAPMTGGMALHQPGPQQSFQGPFANGNPHTLSHAHPSALPPQTQFGPSMTATSAGSGPGANGQGSTLTGTSSMNHVNGGSQNQQQEEISTIFVVGFPEDMQEREFQNMFTFSSGFEAATLKIPNKEYTAYGSTGASGTNSRLPYPGANDPYNLVTVNQGGVVVDGGRDGPTTSWPAAPMQNDESHFIPSNLPAQPPRKQIIGFAKFRTRQEALEARDILQGRRVDVERGSVLKAEMAKKNLHTKRGPGVPPGMPLNSLMNGAGGNVTESLASYASLNGLAGLGGNTGPTGAGELPLAQRDRELGALGAMGIVGLGPRRDRLIDGNGRVEEDRRRTDPSTGSAMLTFSQRGARERAEEDEREQERERKRKEKEVARLRQNSFAFEAFHSVPQQMVRQGANSLLSAENGVLPPGALQHVPMGLSSPPALHKTPSQNEGMHGLSQSPWGNLRDVGASAALRKMSAPVLSSTLPPRPVSPPQQSPPGNFDIPSGLSSGPLSATSQNGSGLPGNRSAPFSPQSNTSSLPSHPSLPTRPRPYSPSNEQQQLQQQPAGVLQPLTSPSSLPASSASSVSGSQSGADEELSRSVAVLAVSTDQGTTSPQLPSPASGASSGTGRASGDQNPPINTLYVGNLPTSPTPSGLPLTYLEDRLRDLFSKRPGYRKLCFRQKSNGPMCFVEFEDVNYATKALNELSGNTLSGLVKGGGIRLSYSKNPLGVRTPTSGKDASMQQQQQSHALGQAFADPYMPRFNDLEVGRGRRDTTGMTSPTSSYHYTTSPPPPRFISPPPTGSFSASLAGPTAFPRANPQAYGLTNTGGGGGSSTTFSPFGIPPSHSMIPDQPNADANNDPLSQSLSSTPSPNIEASRAG